jgi:2-phosphoglycerate kinase
MSVDPTKEQRASHILISDREHGLPYSKGLMASQVMVTGLSPVRAYQVAEIVEERLHGLGMPSVTSDELDEVTVAVLSDVAGDRYAANYRSWRQVEALDIPLVVLIGGATGVGKSTIATQLAARLGIVRVEATDSIREVMRALFSRELMPTLYTSSFEADVALREPPKGGADAVVVGFREQTAAVSVGIEALLDRAAIEGTSLVIEGAHVVPGFFDLASRSDRVLAVPVIITVEDEEVHRSHFDARSMDVTMRPSSRYLSSFENIRRLQRYVKSQALSHGVPVIPNYNFDRSLAAVTDLIMRRTTERAAQVRADDGASAQPTSTVEETPASAGPRRRLRAPSAGSTEEDTHSPRPHRSDDPRDQERDQERERNRA